eukprot:1096004-Amphidinium_carterae.1
MAEGWYSSTAIEAKSRLRVRRYAPTASLLAAGLPRGINYFQLISGDASTPSFKHQVFCKDFSFWHCQTLSGVECGERCHLLHKRRAKGVVDLLEGEIRASSLDTTSL